MLIDFILLFDLCIHNRSIENSIKRTDICIMRIMTPSWTKERKKSNTLILIVYIMLNLDFCFFFAFLFFSLSLSIQPTSCFYICFSVSHIDYFQHSFVEVYWPFLLVIKSKSEFKCQNNYLTANKNKIIWFESTK